MIVFNGLVTRIIGIVIPVIKGIGAPSHKGIVKGHFIDQTSFDLVTGIDLPVKDHGSFDGVIPYIGVPGPINGAFRCTNIGIIIPGVIPAGKSKYTS